MSIPEPRNPRKLSPTKYYIFRRSAKIRETKYREIKRKLTVIRKNKDPREFIPAKIYIFKVFKLTENKKKPFYSIQTQNVQFHFVFAE